MLENIKENLKNMSHDQTTPQQEPTKISRNISPTTEKSQKNVIQETESETMQEAIEYPEIGQPSMEKGNMTTKN